MPLTVAEKINIGRLSGLYTSNELAGGRLIGGQIDKRLPNLIYAVTQGLVWMNELSSPTVDADLVGNYLISICRHSTKAEGVLALNNGGTVAPITPSTGAASVFPIRISSADFVTATEYNDTRITGKNLMIFIDQGNQQWLNSGSDTFAYTLTGIQILFPGFDATANNYTITIEEYTPGQAVGSGSSLLGSYYYGDVDYYSDLISNNDIVPYQGNFASTVGGSMAVTFPSGADAPAGKFLVIRIPSTQTDRSAWINVVTLNQGIIPDSVFRDIISFSGYDYYMTRILFGFNGGILTITFT